AGVSRASTLTSGSTGLPAATSFGGTRKASTPDVAPPSVLTPSPGPSGAPAPAHALGTNCVVSTSATSPTTTVIAGFRLLQDRPMMAALPFPSSENAVRGGVSIGPLPVVRDHHFPCAAVSSSAGVLAVALTW